MRRAFRIGKRRQARFAFTGEGARLAGGRWNNPGIHAVYLSSTLSLAAMETFVHLGDDATRLDFVYFEVGIPAAMPVMTLTHRPKGWRDEPPTNASMRVGDRWLSAGESPLLQVSSAIVPSESNLILNPRHPDSARLRIAAARVFQFDPRMWK